MIEAPPRTAARCREAHARLAAIADRLSDDDVRRPSLVPGWTVGHVLAHLARNGQSMVRRIAAARSGESLEEYVGGSAGRAGHETWTTGHRGNGPEQHRVNARSRGRRIGRTPDACARSA